MWRSTEGSQSCHYASQSRHDCWELHGYGDWFQRRLDRVHGRCCHGELSGCGASKSKTPAMSPGMILVGVKDSRSYGMWTGFVVTARHFCVDHTRAWLGDQYARPQDRCSGQAQEERFPAHLISPRPPSAHRQKLNPMRSSEIARVLLVRSIVPMFKYAETAASDAIAFRIVERL